MLAASVIVHGAYTKNVFAGGKPALIDSFADELPGVTLEQFQHLTSVVRPPVTPEWHLSSALGFFKAQGGTLVSKHFNGLP